MRSEHSLIEKKIVMMPTLVIDKILQREVVVPIKHEFVYGKYLPVEFEKRTEDMPIYKIIKVPKLILI